MTALLWRAFDRGVVRAAAFIAALTLALRRVRSVRASPGRMPAQRNGRARTRPPLAREAERASAAAGRCAPAPISRHDAAATYETFAAFMAALPYPAFIQNERGEFVFVNEAGRSDRAWLEAAAPAKGTGGGSDRHYFGIRFPLEVAGQTWLGGLAIDITQQKAQEAELVRAVRRRDEFLAVLAHELRAPLAPVQHSAQMLQRAPTDVERVRRAATTIERQVGRMERLIADLLDAARISQGVLALAREPVALADLVETTLDAVEPLCERGAHRFDVGHAAPEVRVLVDPLRAEQILVNLLSNAIKYSPPASVVHLRTAVDDGMARVEVSDHGEGICPEHLPEIFTMFARPGARRAAAGSGVGLALAQQLAVLHGGRLEAHSAGPGCGATFILRLPLADEAALAAGSARRDERGAAARGSVGRRA